MNIPILAESSRETVDSEEKAGVWRNAQDHSDWSDIGEAYAQEWVSDN